MESAAARPAEILVRQVEELLVVRVGVDGRHPALLDAERLVEHLGERGQAVRRARRVGDDVMLGGIVRLFVDAQDQRDVLTLGRRGDHHFLGTRRDVFGGAVPVREQARGFEHDVDAEVLPRQLRRSRSRGP
jgi:hypothetical protein